MHIEVLPGLLTLADQATAIAKELGKTTLVELVSDDGYKTETYQPGE